MRRATEITSRCNHCGAVGTPGEGTVIGVWRVCGVCGRPYRWHQSPGRGAAWVRRIFALLLLALSDSTVAQAQEPASSRALVVTAENLMASDARHQALAAAGGDAGTLLPGDVVRYRLRFTNVTQGDVRGVVFTNPVPEGLRYVGGSAAADRGDVVIDYSIDGGRTYAARPMVVKLVDGKRVEQPAKPEQYSHVRWTVRGSISPGAAVTAQLRAMLPAAATPEDTSSQDESTRR